jgi:hypothetical protein
LGRLDDATPCTARPAASTGIVALSLKRDIHEIPARRFRVLCDKHIGTHGDRRKRPILKQLVDPFLHRFIQVTLRNLGDDGVPISAPGLHFIALAEQQ